MVGAVVHARGHVCVGGVLQEENARSVLEMMGLGRNGMDHDPVGTRDSTRWHVCLVL